MGFRDRIEDIGRGLGIDGVVYNYNDGIVRILANFDDRELKEFFKKSIRFLEKKDSMIKIEEIEEKELNTYIEFPSGINRISADDLLELNKKLDEGIKYIKMIFGVLEEHRELLQEIKKTQKDKQPKKIQVRKKTHKISKKIVKKSTSVSAKQKSNLKSLFANVKTKASSVKKKVVNNVQKSLTTSRFKANFEKQTKSNNLLSKFLDDKKVNITKQKIGDTKNEHDLYISKIYEILYQRWQPLLIVDGLSTKVIITIYKDGKFNYRILQYSGDSSFDDQLVLFLEKQKEEKFPIPKKSRIDIEVIFTAKG